MTRWSIAQLAMLRRMTAQYTQDELAKRLGKSLGQVRTKTRQLGLRTKRRQYKRKITDLDELRGLIAAGKSRRDIAKHYGITVRSFRDVVYKYRLNPRLPYDPTHILEALRWGPTTTHRLRIAVGCSSAVLNKLCQAGVIERHRWSGRGPFSATTLWCLPDTPDIEFARVKAELYARWKLARAA